MANVCVQRKCRVLRELQAKLRVHGVVSVGFIDHEPVRHVVSDRCCVGCDDFASVHPDRSLSDVLSGVNGFAAATSDSDSGAVQAWYRVLSSHFFCVGD